MLIADWIVIALIAFFALLGIIFGFGKGLRFFTRGIFGFLISIIFCYCLGGLIIKFSFVQVLLDKLVVALTGKGGFCDVLLAIRIDIIVFYVALFIIVQIVRIIIVSIVSSVFETENVVLKFFNKIFGIVFFVAVLVFMIMFVFQIICLIGGGTEAGFIEKITGSKLKLDWFYTHNPLTEIIYLLFRIEIRIPVPAS